MIYRVEISETYTGVVFDFHTMGAAGNFIKTVLEHGYRNTMDTRITAEIFLVNEEEEEV